MASMMRALSRRGLLKLFLALPFVKVLESFLASLLRPAGAGEAPLKVAKVSELGQPWSSVGFTYRIKVKTRDVYKRDVVTEESVPGLVIRLPDELAQKMGGGAKTKFYVVDLHCTHERCVAAYIADRSEMRAVANVDAKNPMVYCPCHRSVFDVAQEGKAVKGPAKQPLWKFNFDVKGDDIIVTGLDPKASVWEAGRPGGLTVEYPVRPGEPGL